MKAIQRLLAVVVVTAALLLPVLVIVPAPRAAAVADGCTNSFLGLPAWYKYLESDPPPECDITGPRYTAGDQAGEFNWQSAAGFVSLAVLEILIRIAALVAVGYIIYGGYRFILSQGEPENAKSARQTIINALIGVVIAVAAASIVSFVAGRLTS